MKRELVIAGIGVLVVLIAMNVGRPENPQVTKVRAYVAECRRNAEMAKRDPDKECLTVAEAIDATP